MYVKSNYRTSKSSTTKINAANGGIDAPAPYSPYPKLYGMNNLYFDPSLINCKPSVQPFIT